MLTFAFATSATPSQAQAFESPEAWLTGAPLVIPQVQLIDGDQQAVDQVIASRWTPAAVLARTASKTHFEHMSAASAERLDATALPGVAASATPTLEPPSGARIARYLSPTSAEFALPDGRHAVAVANVPIARKTGSGAFAALDLGLRRGASGFTPAGAYTQVHIPAALDEGIGLGATGVSLTPLGSSGAPLDATGTLDDSAAFYANSQLDSDTAVKPTPLGFETSTLLRSADSPQKLVFRVGLPAGAKLIASKRPNGSTAAAVRSTGRTYALIEAPTAEDAAGQPVPVTMKIAGDRLVLTVAHRDGDYQYPIDVDPTVSDGSSTGATNWRFARGGGVEHTGIEGNFIYEYYTGESWIIRPEVGHFASEWGAVLYPTQGESHIYALWAESSANDTATPAANSMGIFSASGWETNLPLPTAYGRTANTVCVTSGCEPSSGSAGNLAAYWVSTTGGGAAGEATMYAAVVYIAQNNGPSASFDTTTPEWSGTKNALDPPAWIGPHSGTGLHVHLSDPGVGVREVTYSTPGLEWKQNPECAGPVQCPESVVQSAGYNTPAGVLPDGEPTLTVKASDAMGSVASTSAKVLVDGTAPTELEVTGLPANGELGDANRALTVKAKAKDGSGTTLSSGIASFKMAIDGQEVGTPNGKCITGGPCTASAEWPLNSEEYAQGKHTLTVTVTDRAGNSTTSTIPLTVHHASPVALGPGELNPVTGDFDLEATDVSLASSGAPLRVTRAFDSRDPTAGGEGPLGSPWAISFAGAQNLEVLPASGNVVLRDATGHQSVFVNAGGGNYTPPAGDAGLALTKTGNEYVLSHKGASTRFTHVAGDSSWVWHPTIASGVGGSSSTLFSYQVVGGVVEPVEELAPVPAGVSCTTELQKGCRALTFSYAKATTATGEGSSEWGEYNGRLASVFFTAYDPAAGTMKTTAVAQYAYDNKGRLRAEWDPRVSPALKTTYGYDAEGHVSSVSAPGREPWLLGYGTTSSDTTPGRLLWAQRPTASTELSSGKAPVSSTTPTVTGSAVVGVRMTVSDGAWSNAPLAYGYQWQSCSSAGTECKPIGGANNPNYTPVSGDLGHTLVVRVTASNASGSTVVSTAPTMPVASAAGALSQPVDPGKSLNAVSCVSTSTTCVVGDSAGAVMDATNVSASAPATWKPWTAPSGHGPAQALACTGMSLCLLADGPSGMSGTVYYATALGGTFKEGFTNPDGADALSCPEATFCIAAQNAGGLFSYSTSPASTYWLVEHQGTATMKSVHCLNPGFCAIADGSGTVHLATTATQVKSPSWTTTDVDGSTPLNGVACTSTTNCVAVDNTGKALSLTIGETGGATSVSTRVSPTGTSLVAVACPVEVTKGGTKVVCVTIDNEGEVFVSESGKGAWKELFKLGLKVTALSCASPTLCVAVDSSGDTISFNPAGGTAQQGEVRNPPQRVTIEYGVPVSGSGAPYVMSSGEVARWAQSDVPTEATAIFPPDEPVNWPAPDYRRATVLYLDASEREVNTASPGGEISTTEYNSTSDVVRTLSAEDRDGALKEGSKSAEAAQRLDTQSTYASEGTELTSTLGPLQPIQLANGTQVSARRHVLYSYDEGAPAEGGPYRLLTKTTEGAQIEGQAEADVRTSTASYAGQNNLGWMLHKPTSVTTDPAGLALTRRTIYDPTSGEVTETRTPAAGAPGNEVLSGYLYSSGFGSSGPKGGQLAKPAAIAREASGNLWVADTENNRVEEYSASGTFVQAIGTLGTGNGQLKAPEGVAVDNEGHVLVADTGNNRIQEFTTTGTYIQAIKVPPVDGEFKAPSGLAYASNRLYVADTGNNRIVELTSSGQYVKAFNGTLGAGGKEALGEPRGVAVDGAGTIWVADTAHNRVEQFSAAGAFMKKFGSLGTGEGQMTRPEGIAIDSERHVFVADAGNSRVDEFGSTGSPIGHFGSLGSGEENMKGPKGIVLDATNDAFVLDSGNNRVEKWTPVIGTGGTHGSQTVYYTAGANSKVAVCGLHAEWAGLPCEMRPAGQPETSGVPNLPVTVVTYNLWDEPATSTQTVGAATRTTTDTYDAAGRLSTEGVSASQGTVLPAVSYEYNPETGAQTKQSTTSSSGTLTIERAFDRRGERTSYKDADGNTSTFGFDIDGRLESFNDGKGTQTYSYDATTGELTKLVDSAAGTFGASYDADGDLTSVAYPNGLMQTRTYDGAGDETGISYVQSAHCETKCTLYSQAQTLSVHGQALNETSTLSAQSYSYDEAGRLTRAQDTPAGEGCTTRVYGYDQETNIASVTTRAPGTGGQCASEGGTVVNHTYDTANRLTDSGVSYDAFGDITSLPAGDAGGSALTSTFFADETLASQSQGGQTLTYGLDPLGRSHLVTASGGTGTTSHYSDDSRAASWTVDSTGQWKRNIPGIGGLAAIQSSGSAPVLQIEDLHGDVVGTASISEGASTFLSTSEATEYGVPRKANPPKYAWLGGASIPTELSSGVIGMGARSYVPTLGRFLQPDPIPGGSANEYAYTYGDPVNTWDPSGEFTVATPSWVGEFLTERAEALTEEAIQRAAEEQAAREEAEENVRDAYEDTDWSFVAGSEGPSGGASEGPSGGDSAKKQSVKNGKASLFIFHEGGFKGKDCKRPFSIRCGESGDPEEPPTKPKPRPECPPRTASYHPGGESVELSGGLYYGGSTVKDVSCGSDGGDPTLPCPFAWCTGGPGEVMEAWEQWPGEPARNRNGQRDARGTRPTAA
ncbi:MAG TPA: RHS repeat-associated core domain-containing protein [Solirubrobacteraceae bacterium]|nr:RHS repeat-associated core domain-containing protein [Solirubrobacteraceae bacterium]